MKPVLLAIALLACAQPLEERLAAAQTASDVDAIVGKDPTCTDAGGGFRSCTWRAPAFSSSNCTGYADCSSPRRTLPPRVVTCRVDRDDRVSGCATDRS